MFLPVGDAPNPRDYRPWVNWALMALNVLVFLVLLPLSWQAVDPADPRVREYLEAILSSSPELAGQIPALIRSLSQYDLFVFEHGFRPGAPRWSEVLWAMFLHGGLGHLAGNMLFLWIFGDNLEHHLGRWRYLLFYLGTGALATLGDALIRFGSDIPAVGASGAISGVLGAYFIWFPRNRVRVWVLLLPIWVEQVEIPARWVLGFYVVVQNLLPLLLGGGGGVSYGAHLGGFAAGVAAAWLLDRRQFTPGQRGQVRKRAHVSGADAVLAGYRRAVAARRPREASEQLFQLPTRTVARQIDPGELLWIAGSLERAGERDAALRAYRLHLAAHPRGPGLAAAHLGCARILLETYSLPTEAYQHLHAALRTAQDIVHVAEARALWDELTRRGVALPRRSG